MASRYSTLEGPIAWLQKAGLVHQVRIVEHVESPLQSMAHERRFKLYLFDVGILGAMLNLAPEAIINYDYGRYKGYFVENAVLMELTSRWQQPLYSWQRNTSEIEFLLEAGSEIIPIEVKAGINTKAKSLRVYRERYEPKQALLLSNNRLTVSSHDTYYLPLYLASRFPEVI